MKSFDELEFKYKDAIEQYDLNSAWARDLRETILSLKDPKEIVLSCLLDGLEECFEKKIKAESYLLKNGFNENEIILLCCQYSEYCNK